MQLEAVIGLEVHAQLLTDSKIFCGCSTRFGAEPNHNTCPVCLGMPGVLPVLNKKVVDYALRTALATNCQIAPYSIFARKNYFYPDLPKGYQISQYEKPLAEKGWVDIEVEEGERRIGITRIHLEEDAGKLIHEEGARGAFSYVDFNRTGVPLIEIVSEPDIRSPEEASEYLRSLRDILRYLEVCDGNMEEGSFRCDANVSIRQRGEKGMGVKAEVKNMNSFRFVQRALEYEISRQKGVLEEGGKIIQETRLWEESRGVTISMRGKEEAHDYRYFPEPDLIPLKIDPSWIERIKETLPELPGERKERFIREYQLPPDDAGLLTGNKALADYYEKCVKLYNKTKIVSNWIMGEVSAKLKSKELEIEQCPVTPEMLTGMLKLVDKGTISGKIAKDVFNQIWESGKSAEEIVEEKGLVQVSDAAEIEQIVDKVLADNPAEIEQYRAGKDKLLGFFVGQVMKASEGKANPRIVNEIVRKKLGR
ncbi:MAG: Asp-tRNA(Asn)/Glu-tRNA(Gln) amidotransferase subunit GatB [Deltaproteobacteria bacterium]|nr:MAG: Asp-tRNA(Asn)/Glu-tRNA(Gln) amidotransferase subunit GatB [Deltaproteobacteria bacterium]